MAEKFPNNALGKKLAKRYVYGVLDMMLKAEFSDKDGWMFGGIEDKQDLQKVTEAIKAIRVEFSKRYDRINGFWKS